jgi:hypothetical protein
VVVNGGRLAVDFRLDGDAVCDLRLTGDAVTACEGVTGAQ